MTANSMWAISCLVLAIIFAIFAIIFALLKEKCAGMISGFNFLSKKEREEYDTLKMTKDMRNQFALWALVLFIGAVFSYLISFYFAIGASVVFLFLFFKDVHLNIDKAFGRYKK